CAAARDCDGLRVGEGRIGDKWLCSMDHPAALCRERACRTFRERTMGVLWHHSSVNLVEPRSIAPAGPRTLRRVPGIAFPVSITPCSPQPVRQIRIAGIRRLNFALTKFA